jgi:hypothetical protein
MEWWNLHLERKKYHRGFEKFQPQMNALFLEGWGRL